LAQTREIKNRSVSVQNTAKITKALQLVSAAKMQKAQQRAIQAKAYATALTELVGKLYGNDDIENRMFAELVNPRKIAIVVIGTSRGFVGGTLTSLALKTKKLADELSERFPTAELVGISVHKTGAKILLHAGITNEAHFAKYVDAPTSLDISTIKSYLLEGFDSGEFDAVFVTYSEFYSTLLQKSTYRQLLPVVRTEGTDRSSDSAIESFIWEPSAEKVLTLLLSEYFEVQLFTAILESIASEHSARMVSMQKATDNAVGLIKSLTLLYNKTRQAQITQELVEIVSGSL